MTSYTHDTVPTRFVEANGIRFGRAAGPKHLERKHGRKEVSGASATRNTRRSSS